MTVRRLQPGTTPEARTARGVCATLAGLGVSAACLLLAACGEMKPRPTADQVVAAPPQEQPKDVDHMNYSLDHNSSSTLGKARDSAIRGVRNAEKHSEEVAKEADEVLKPRKTPPPAKPSETP